MRRQYQNLGNKKAWRWGKGGQKVSKIVWRHLWTTPLQDETMLTCGSRTFNQKTYFKTYFVYKIKAGGRGFESCPTQKFSKIFKLISIMPKNLLGWINQLKIFTSVSRTFLFIIENMNFPIGLKFLRMFRLQFTIYSWQSIQKLTFVLIARWCRDACGNPTLGTCNVPI